jgi:hypothetical protein
MLKVAEIQARCPLPRDSGQNFFPLAMMITYTLLGRFIPLVQARPGRTGMVGV